MAQPRRKTHAGNPNPLFGSQESSSHRITESFISCIDQPWMGVVVYPPLPDESRVTFRRQGARWEYSARLETYRFVSRLTEVSYCILPSSLSAGEVVKMRFQ